MVDDGRGRSHEVAQRLLDAHNTKDLASLRSLLADDVRYWSVLAGPLVGADDVIAEMSRIFQSLPNDELTVLRQAADAETCVAEFEASGTSASGEDYRHEYAQVLELDDGLITSIKVYLDPEAVPVALSLQ